MCWPTTDPLLFNVKGRGKADDGQVKVRVEVLSFLSLTFKDMKFGLSM